MALPLEPGSPSRAETTRPRRARAAAPALAALAALAGAAPPAVSAAADNWAQKSYENFSPREARRAQSYLAAAMRAPPGPAARAASEIRAADMLTYGLALVLGRAPQPDALDAAGRKRVDALLQTALAVYQRDLGPAAKPLALGDAVDQGELWVWMSRMLSIKPQRDIDVTTSADASAGQAAPSPDTPATPGENLVTGTIDVQPAQLTGPDGRGYTLNGDLPVLDARVVSAAYACADYAYTAARMARVAALDPAAQTVPRERMVEIQRQAEDLVRLAAAQGPGACAGAPFFAQVTQFAAAHLGRVGRLRLLDPGRAATAPVP